MRRLANRLSRPAVWLFLALASIDSARADDRLNVVFIVADDLNTQLGCYGAPEVETPHIDRLAARGVRFDRAYCQYPLCNPSRASFMTGMRPDHTRVHDNATHFRKALPNAITMPQFFMSQGYRVARVGKLYHYGVPGQIGTSGLDDAPSWHEVVNPIGRDKTDEARVFSINPKAGLGGTVSWLAADGTDEEQTDGKGAAAAIELLEKSKAGPFFLAVGFYRPHTPYVAPKPWFDRLPLEQVSLAQVCPTGREGIPAAAFNAREPHNGMSVATQREAKRAYLASIAFMDAQVGKVLDAIERLGLADKTIVVMTGDHGYHLGEHGLWQKQSLFEESTRVPFIIAAPGKAGRGRSTRAIVEMIDFYPTLAKLCGFEPPAELDGRSLVPFLDDPATPDDHAALTQVARRGRGESAFMGYSLRTDRYRYTEWDGGAKGAQLYDMERDPLQFRNLADDPGSAETRSRLHELLMKRKGS
ncbi:MAG: sulfatase [Isosphaeraceae bacterium]|nr:sulfatase [Isosphaeraceae bacterium]